MIFIYIYLYHPDGFFPYVYDGYYSETDRTGTVQKTIHLSQRPSPHDHDVFSHPIVTTLYTSALLVAELGSCLHP